MVEQCLGGHEEAGRADTALQGGAFEERLLQRMQMIAVNPVGGGQTLDREQVTTLGLGANTRHAQVTLPSIRTEQAPQSPVPQPSLAPVSPSSSRRASSNEVRGSARKSVSSPLTVQVMCVRLMRGPFGGEDGGPLGEHTGDLDAVLDGAALVVDRVCRGGGRSGDLGKGRLVEARADEGRLGVRNPHSGGRNSAEHHTGIGAGVAIHRDANSGADDGDVHLRARSHPDVRIAGVRRRIVDLELDDELTVGERELAGAGDDIGDRDGALAVGAGDHRTRSEAIIAGTLSAAGEPLQRFPPRLERFWI